MFHLPLAMRWVLLSGPHLPLKDCKDYKNEAVSQEV